MDNGRYDTIACVGPERTNRSRLNCMDPICRSGLARDENFSLTLIALCQPVTASFTCI